MPALGKGRLDQAAAHVPNANEARCACCARASSSRCGWPTPRCRARRLRLSQVRLDIRASLVSRGYLTVEELESLGKKEAIATALTARHRADAE